MTEWIDFRSDTVTKPTKEMRLAMMNAEVGDDVYGDDPTVNRLEEMAAEMMGKEKALFVPSGTMGNQICINAHTNRGDEIILQENHHIFKYEVGGVAALSSVQTKTLKSIDGCYDMESLRNAIRGQNIHFPVTKVVCIEDTHNIEGGMVVPQEHLSQLKAIAEEENINVHMDGARIFHAAEYLNIPVSEIAHYADSVMFCLSKALASPVGSLIAGTEQFIDKARKIRKRFGGGMRQAGVLAACGILSLTDMVKHLPTDHRHAKELAEGIAEIDGLNINIGKVHTNIVIFTIDEEKMTAVELCENLKLYNVLSTVIDTYTMRLIPHYEISDSDITYILKILKEVI